MLSITYANYFFFIFVFTTRNRKARQVYPSCFIRVAPSSQYEMTVGVVTVVVGVTTVCTTGVVVTTGGVVMTGVVVITGVGATTTGGGGGTRADPTTPPTTPPTNPGQKLHPPRPQ